MQDSYYRRVLVLEVLSDRDLSDLGPADLIHEADNGEASGMILADATTTVSADEMRGLLLAQGSEPGFLGIDDDDDGVRDGH